VELTSVLTEQEKEMQVSATSMNAEKNKATLGLKTFLARVIW